MKLELRNINKNEFSGISEQVKKTRVEQIQVDLLYDPDNSQLQEKERVHAN